MKMKFRGWTREVFPHNHDIKPATQLKRISRGPRAIATDDGVVIGGKISKTQLSGDFYVQVELSQADLDKLIEAKIEADPISATEWLSNRQATALTAALRCANATELEDDEVA